VTTWIVWAVILLLQNFSFTFVSRARNSGSLRRHMIASLLSNGVWFVSQGMIFTKLYKIMTGDYGLGMAAFTCAFYTAFTLLGSAIGHHISLLTEKGQASVGANKKYAQILKEDWEMVKDVVNYHLQPKDKIA
jgi:hypothetical protein